MAANSGELVRALRLATGPAVEPRARGETESALRTAPVLVRWRPRFLPLLGLSQSSHSCALVMSTGFQLLEPWPLAGGVPDTVPCFSATLARSRTAGGVSTACSL